MKEDISLLKTFGKYLKIAKKHRIPISSSIRLFPKVTKAKSYYGECIEREDHIEIRISEMAFEDDCLEETIVHELCHTIKGCWKHNQKFHCWLEKFRKIV